MTTTHKGKGERKTYQEFSDHYWLQIRAKLLQPVCIIDGF